MNKFLITILLIIIPKLVFATNFPTSPVLDSFNRANGAPSGWTGAAFGDANGITITSNAATSGANAFGASFYNVNTYKYATNVIEAYYTISTLPAAGHSTRIVICDDSNCASNNAYYMVVTPDGGANNWDLEKLVAGVGSQLGALFTQVVSAGDSIGLSIVESGGSNTITAWYQSGSGSWTALTTRSDSSNLSKKWYIGVELQDNTVRIDNFGGGNVGDNGKMFL